MPREAQPSQSRRKFAHPDSVPNDAPHRAAGNAPGYPRVEGICPACSKETLFLGAAGFVTCSLIGCPDPCAPSKALGAL